MGQSPGCTCTYEKTEGDNPMNITPTNMSEGRMALTVLNMKTCAFGKTCCCDSLAADNEVQPFLLVHPTIACARAPCRPLARVSACQKGGSAAAVTAWPRPRRANKLSWSLHDR